MKKLLSGFFALLMLVGTIQAQDIEPAKALKKVKRLLASYNANPIENSDKLNEAKEMVEIAMSDATLADSYKALAAKAEVYNEMAGRDAQNFVLAQTQGKLEGFELMSPMAGVKAYEAYKMAFDKAEKKYETKGVLKGLQDVASNLATVGNIQLEMQDYKGAYHTLSTVLGVRDMLNANGMETVLTEEADLNNHKYVVGYCAMVADQKDEAKMLFQDLVKAGYHEDGRVHSYLFDMMKDEDEEAALKILNEGAAAYPENKDILFSKINYYIQKEDYKTLQGELERAIEAAPDNPSVYSALGNVYMNLFQEEYAAGNMEKADDYFAKSKDYYEQALQLDDGLFDVQYSIGSLYYNKAVEVTKLMNDLPINETKKYDAYNDETKELFKEALPYFKKAESMNANDLNTLIALKEIFARLDDFETSNEFKTRIEKLQAGGQNDASYFKM